MQRYAKAIVAAIVSITTLLAMYFPGFEPVTEEQATTVAEGVVTVMAILNPIVVYFFPNRDVV